MESNVLKTISGPDAHTNDINNVKKKMRNEYERICFKRVISELIGQVRGLPKITQFLLLTNPREVVYFGSCTSPERKGFTGD